MTGEGFVLAGGQSRRMGGDKALVRYGSKTLLQHAVAILRRLGAPIRLVVNRHQKLAAAGCIVVVDEIEDAGPLGGLLTALRFSSSEINYVLACDLPLVPAQLFRILEKAAVPEWDAAVPADRSGKIHPLCAVYRRSCLTEIERRIAAGELRMDRFVAASNLQIQIVTSDQHGLPDRRFWNVNRPGDLAAGPPDPS